MSVKTPVIMNPTDMIMDPSIFPNLVACLEQGQGVHLTHQDIINQAADQVADQELDRQTQALTTLKGIDLSQIPSPDLELTGCSQKTTPTKIKLITAYTKAAGTVDLEAEKEKDKKTVQTVQGVADIEADKETVMTVHGIADLEADTDHQSTYTKIKKQLIQPN